MESTLRRVLSAALFLASSFASTAWCQPTTEPNPYQPTTAPTATDVPANAPSNVAPIDAAPSPTAPAVAAQATAAPNAAAPNAAASNVAATIETPESAPAAAPTVPPEAAPSERALTPSAAKDTSAPHAPERLDASEEPPQLGPKSLPYDGRPAPDGYVLERRTLKPVWISGTATLLNTWALSAWVGIASHHEVLAIPLAGPWIHWYNHQLNQRTRVPDVIMGSVQTIGVILIVTGLLMDDPRYLRADLAGVQVSPTLSADSLGLTGTF